VEGRVVEQEVEVEVCISNLKGYTLRKFRFGQLCIAGIWILDTDLPTYKASHNRIFTKK
jgi:hypothetical protein